MSSHQISKRFSVALDAVRLGAALTVFLHHANWLGLDHGLFGWFRRDVGHSAVVVFFVLSGYVIAAASTRDTALTYAIKRASRVLTVAIPALALTLCLDAVVQAWSLPVLIPAYELRRPLLYFAVALSFIGDSWSLAVPAFSDVPFWSLNYEVWYYVAFAVALFARGTWRVLGLGIVLAIMGPKLWALFPIWLAGAGLHRIDRTVSARTGRLLVLGALAALLFLKVFNVEDALNGAAALTGFPLRFSQWFMGDILLALPMLVLVYGLANAALEIPAWAAALIRAGAGVSFSLYLVHFPLMSFFAALLPGPLAVAVALLCSIAFGAVFEPQKDRLRRGLTAAVATLRRPALAR